MSSNNNAGDERNVLCVMPTALGGSVCVLPEVRLLAKEYGHPVDVLVRRRQYIDLFVRAGDINKCYYLPHWNIPFWLSWTKLRTGLEIRRNRYEHIYLYSLPERKNWEKFRRFLHRCGVDPKTIVMEYHFCRTPEQMRHRRFPGAEELATPLLVVKPDDRLAVEKRLADELAWRGEPVVLMHPGFSLMASGKAVDKAKFDKWWPEENWRRVAVAIRERLPDSVIIFSGSGMEGRTTKEIAKLLGGREKRFVDWAGSLSLGQLIALQSLAHSCVSIDTGAAHTAMAVGCPIVVLYGNLDPRSMGRCSPKSRGPVSTVRGFTEWDDVEKNPVPWLQQVTPGKVIEAWEALTGRYDAGVVNTMVTHFREGGGAPEIRPVFYESLAVP